jgi:hypothetical protein
MAEHSARAHFADAPRNTLQFCTTTSFPAQAHGTVGPGWAELIFATRPRRFNQRQDVAFHGVGNATATRGACKSQSCFVVAGTTASLLLMEVPVNVDEGDEDAVEGEGATTDDTLVSGADGDSTALVALSDPSVAARIAAPDHPAVPAWSSAPAAADDAGVGAASNNATNVTGRVVIHTCCDASYPSHTPLSARSSASAASLVVEMSCVGRH